jgi:hypothetical protein
MKSSGLLRMKMWFGAAKWLAGRSAGISVYGLTLSISAFGAIRVSKLDLSGEIK